MRRLRGRALVLLGKWLPFSDTGWLPLSDETGFFGTGYTGWGVQTNQKFLSAMAALAHFAPGFQLDVDVSLIRRRALSALRYSVDSHASGQGACADGRQWGRHWLASLGIERMMHGVELLSPSFEDSLRHSLNRMLASEADWIQREYHRDGITGITGSLWSSQGGNGPESNIWAGSLLWRAAHIMPDHPSASDWKEKAHEFLINGVSIPSDADDQRICAGRTVGERFHGANFFPSFSLDHHHYFNVGYMGICVSNAAILHFDCRSKGLVPPSSLYHHQKDLWQVLRRLIFSNGRLARLGGDSRVRYAYCQDYLIPALLFAADHWQDAHAIGLIEEALDWIEAEQDFNGDGSFFGRRIESIREINPYYVWRLETDRACVLGMLAAYGAQTRPAETSQSLEDSVQGGWIAPDHGDVFHRCPTRLASFSWHAFGKAQGLCLPPDEGHMAEWLHNLSGWVHFAPQRLDERAHIRRVIGHASTLFDGGFATIGALAEGGNSKWADGWFAADAAIHWIAVVALPDGRTMVGLQFCQTTDWHTYVTDVKALHLNVPNDLFNGCRRTFYTEAGECVLHAPAPREEILDLQSPWINIEGKIGVSLAYGASSLVVARSPHRAGDKFRSLYVEEVCLPFEKRCRHVLPHTTLIDAGWVVQSGASPDETSAVSAEIHAGVSHPWHREIAVPGADGQRYVIRAEFAEVSFPGPVLQSPVRIAVRNSDGFHASASIGSFR